MAKPRWLLLASTFLAGMAIVAVVGPLHEINAQIISNGSQSGGGSCSPSCVTSLNTLTGSVTLSAGANITLTPVGNDIEIASTGGGGTFADQAECEAGVVDNEIASPECVEQYYANIFPPQAGNGGRHLVTSGSTLDWGGYILKDYVAARIQNTVASLGFSDGDCGGGTTCPTAVPITGTNTVYAVASFGDSTDQYVYDQFQLPLGTLPPISVSVAVSVDDTTTDIVTPSIAIKCVARTGGNPDAAYNSTQTVNITPVGTANYPVTGVISLNLAGCNAGDLLQWRGSRDRTDASVAEMQYHQVTFYVPEP